MAHEHGKPVLANEPFPDVVVPVYPGAARPLGVVGVDGHHICRTRARVQLRQHVLDTLAGGQVIPCGETVLGVQADLQPLVIDRPQDRAQLLEPGTDVLAHTCHVLHREARTVGRLVQCLPDAIGHLRQHRLEAGFTVAAGMENEPLGSQLPREAKVRGEGIYPLFQDVRPVGAQVDKVDRMQKHRAHSGVGHILPVSLYLGLRDITESP